MVDYCAYIHGDYIPPTRLKHAFGFGDCLSGASLPLLVHLSSPSIYVSLWTRLHEGVRMSSWSMTEHGLEGAGGVTFLNRTDTRSVHLFD